LNDWLDTVTTFELFVGYPIAPLKPPASGSRSAPVPAVPLTGSTVAPCERMVPLEVGVAVGLAVGDGLEVTTGVGLGVGLGLGVELGIDEGDALGDAIGEGEAEGDGDAIGGNGPTRMPIRYDAPPTIVTSESGPR
jgi:hypothetical protein